jgi:hypothetical protein
VKLSLDNVTTVEKLFLIVTIFAELVVPTVCEEKVKLDGVTDTGTTPVPVRLTVCGLLFAPSVTVRVANFAPAVAGVNVN